MSRVVAGQDGEGRGGSTARGSRGRPPPGAGEGGNRPGVAFVLSHLAPTMEYEATMLYLLAGWLQSWPWRKQEPAGEVNGAEVRWWL